MKSLNGKWFGSTISELPDKGDPMLQVMVLEAHCTAQGHVMNEDWEDYTYPWSPPMQQKIPQTHKVDSKWIIIWKNKNQKDMQGSLPILSTINSPSFFKIMRIGTLITDVRLFIICSQARHSFSSDIRLHYVITDKYIELSKSFLKAKSEGTYEWILVWKLLITVSKMSTESLQYTKSRVPMWLAQNEGWDFC